MIEWVAKRDGRVVPFNAEKIADAIFAAAKAVGGEDRRQAEFLAGQVIHLLAQVQPAGGQPQVEQIQDLVEKVLIEHGHARTAKAYILYRNRRTRIRDQKSELMDAVSEVLQETGLDFGESSTPAAKLQRIAFAASEQYALHSLLPPEFANLHRRGVLHIDQLAEYSLSVAACLVRPADLTKDGIRLGQRYLPPAKNLSELLRLVGRLALLAQQELVGELLFRDLDRAVAMLAVPPEPAEFSQQLAHMLLDFELVRAISGPKAMSITCSLGLDRSPLGQAFTEAMLLAVAAGLPSGGPVLSPKLLLQLTDQEPPAASLRLLDGCRQAPLLDQLRFVRLGCAPHPALFASGLCLWPDEPALVARTFVNLPHLALEAEQSSDFWSGIDAALSLAVRQLVHRFEVLAALPECDLPLILPGQPPPPAAGAREGKAVLEMCQLSLVPVGLPEALQVAKLRFGSEIELNEGDLAQLHRRISEHWRDHYALRLTIGQIACEAVAKRFLEADKQIFPLARTLWPDSSGYSLARATPHFLGGQFVRGDFPEQAPANVVFALDVLRGSDPHFC